MPPSFLLTRRNGLRAAAATTKRKKAKAKGSKDAPESFTTTCREMGLSGGHVEVKVR